MAATLAAITPTLTRLVQELQTGFANECQKKLDEQRAVLERRVQMLEAELVVEKKRRIQAEALCNAYKNQLGPNQPQVDSLSVFLSCVAEFADELKSMVHTMYKISPNDPSNIAENFHHGCPTASEVPTPMSEPLTASDEQASSTIQHYASDDEQHFIDDDFVPASKLPNHRSNYSMQVDPVDSDPMLLIGQSPISDSDASQRPSSTFIQSCPDTQQIDSSAHLGAPAILIPPLAPKNEHIAVSDTNNSSISATGSANSTPMVSQSLLGTESTVCPETIPTASASPYSPVPAKLPPELTASSQHCDYPCIATSAETISQPSEVAASSQNTEKPSITVTSPRFESVQHNHGFPDSRSATNELSSPDTLEKEVIQLLQTKSSSTCCDVKAIPLMYSSRYEKNFLKRLIQVGLSSLETFVNYFRWRSDNGKTLLIFTEKVLDNQTKIFISVKQESRCDFSKQENLNGSRSPSMLKRRRSPPADRRSSRHTSILSTSRSPEHSSARRSSPRYGARVSSSRSRSPDWRHLNSSRSGYRTSRNDSSHYHSYNESRSHSRSSSKENGSKNSERSRRIEDSKFGFCYFFNGAGYCPKISTCRYTHACKLCHSFQHEQHACPR